MGIGGVEANEEEDSLHYKGIRIPKRLIAGLVLAVVLGVVILWVGASYYAYDAGFKQGYAEAVKKCLIPISPALGGFVESDATLNIAGG